MLTKFCTARSAAIGRRTSTQLPVFISFLSSSSSFSALLRCPYPVFWRQDAGAIAVLICNTQPGAPMVMTAKDAQQARKVRIPAFMCTSADATVVLHALAQAAGPAAAGPLVAAVQWAQIAAGSTVVIAGGSRLKQLQALARRARQEKRTQRAAELVQHRAFAANQVPLRPHSATTIF